MKKKAWKKILGILALTAVTVSVAEYGRMEIHAEVKAADYLLPEGADRYYTESEISGMTPQILCYAKNEIYAKHGRKFHSEELQKYFDEQTWYYGNVEPENFSESIFNAYEIANIKLLTDRERELQEGGYVLDRPGYDFENVTEYIYGSGDGFFIDAGLSVRSSEGMALVETDYFTIMLPGDLEWEYEVEGRDSISFIYTPARKAGVGGKFLEIKAFDWGDNDYESWPDWRIAGTDVDKKYIAILPTDAQFDVTDAVQTEEYQRLLRCAERCDRNAEDPVFYVNNP